MPSRKRTLRLPAALDTAVQAHLDATHQPFADLMRDALTAYLGLGADTQPTWADTATRLAALETQVAALTAQMRTPPTPERTRERAPAPTRADTPQTPADYPPFDATKNRLGRLCPRGHEWGHTGQSLLRLPNQTCRQCENELRREKRAARRQG